MKIEEGHDHPLSGKTIDVEVNENPLIIAGQMYGGYKALKHEKLLFNTHEYEAPIYYHGDVRPIVGDH
jgi:hypothetical protein